MASNDEENLVKIFSTYCSVKTKDQFTSTACGKFVKDCIDPYLKDDYKGKNIGNIIDGSVFSKCKEDKKTPYMLLKESNCEKFLKTTADVLYEHKAVRKSADDLYGDIKNHVLSTKGKVVKGTKTSATGGVGRMTDASQYTGSHKERFDSEGKGKGKEGRVDAQKNTGYVGAYKDADTYDSKKK